MAFNHPMDDIADRLAGDLGIYQYRIGETKAFECPICETKKIYKNPDWHTWHGRFLYSEDRNISIVCKSDICHSRTEDFIKFLTNKN